MVLIPLAVGIIGILVYSFISMSIDPNRPYFDAVFHDDLDRFITLAQSQYPDYFSAGQSTETAPTAPPASPSLFINNPAAFPSPLAKHLCRTLIDAHGNNLFHWAAKSLSLKSALFLFHIGCDHDQGNFRGSTPFMWACTDTSLNPSSYPEYHQVDSVLERYKHSHESWYNTTQEEQPNPDHTPNQQVNDATASTGNSVAEDDLSNEVQQPPHPQRNEDPPGRASEGESELDRRRRLKASEPLIASAVAYAHIPYNHMLLLLYTFSQHKDAELLHKHNQRSPTTFSSHNSQDSHAYRLLNHQNTDGVTAMHFAAEFLSIASIKTLLTIGTSNPGFINRDVVKLVNDQPQHHHQQPLNSIYLDLLPSLAAFQTTLSSLQSNYPASIKPITFAPTVTTTLLHQLVTKDDDNSPLHVLPSEDACYNDGHCKKAVTLLIGAGFNPKLQNRYKRNLEHHLSLEKITPLLAPVDEIIVAQFLGAEPPSHIRQQLITQRQAELGRVTPQSDSPHIPTDGNSQQPPQRHTQQHQQEAQKIKEELDHRKAQRRHARHQTENAPT